MHCGLLKRSTPEGNWAAHCTGAGTYPWPHQEIQIFLSTKKQTEIHPLNQSLMLPTCLIVVVRRLGPARIMSVSRGKKVNIT